MKLLSKYDGIIELNCSVPSMGQGSRDELMCKLIDSKTNEPLGGPRDPRIFWMSVLKVGTGVDRMNFDNGYYDIRFSRPRSCEAKEDEDNDDIVLECI